MENKKEESKEEVDELEEEPPKVYFYLGTVPVDDEFIDNIGRGGGRKR